MKYVVKCINQYIDNCFNLDPNCKHSTIDIYETESIECCIEAIKDMMDVPIAELSLDEIKKDFNILDIDESKAVLIMNYYNGRLAISRLIVLDILDALEDNFKEQRTFSFDIPEEYNNFCVEDSVDSPKLIVAQIVVEVTEL